MRNRGIQDFNPFKDTDARRSAKSLKQAYDLANRVGVVPLPVSAIVDPIAAFTAPLRAIMRASQGAHAHELRVL